MALTRQAHTLVREHFANSTGGLAIDATCGNGHDTEFLARLGFDNVIGFDVQESAIVNTQKRLGLAGLTNVELKHCGHERISEFIEGEISCAMFNFGYLPKADKNITTSEASSLAALKTSLDHLSAAGIICLICYPGHPAGKTETASIKRWLSKLDQHWLVNEYLSTRPNSSTPVMFTIKAKKQHLNR